MLTDTDTDTGYTDTDYTDTDLSVSVSAKLIGKTDYRSSPNTHTPYYHIDYIILEKDFYHILCLF